MFRFWGALFGEGGAGVRVHNVLLKTTFLRVSRLAMAVITPTIAHSRQPHGSCDGCIWCATFVVALARRFVIERDIASAFRIRGFGVNKGPIAPSLPFIGTLRHGYHK